ncbi:HVO_0234 family beta-propeller protein [Halosimplex halobium]|uniref:HVO_0234 family beta-propeller protein n=1 Tax=Halosimplex halobium TaxID=3396618 RepID=UPI003F55DE94
MSAIEEKRMYGDRREETVAYLATGQGVATVRVSGDQVGRFGLAHRTAARDVATTDGAVVVATDEAVLVGPDEFESLGFGPAVAVGTDREDDVLAADESGRVARYRDGEWTDLGTVGDVRAIADGFVAAADGVHRVDGADLVNAGLDAARDVATVDGVPLAATDDGLYRLGNGWLREREGSFRVVAGGGDHAHAATADELFERDGEAWTAVDLPVDEQVVSVDYGECVYAVTAGGTFLVEADPETTADGAGGWRSRSLGLPDVAALAVA